MRSNENKLLKVFLLLNFYANSAGYAASLVYNRLDDFVRNAKVASLVECAVFKCFFCCCIFGQLHARPVMGLEVWYG